jgi:hypothetical protein
VQSHGPSAGAQVSAAQAAASSPVAAAPVAAEAAVRSSITQSTPLSQPVPGLLAASAGKVSAAAAAAQASLAAPELILPALGTGPVAHFVSELNLPSFDSLFD